MLVLILVGLALMAVDPSDEQELKLLRGNCPMFWLSFGNCCYKYVATPLIWADAELHCVSQNAKLVSVRGSIEETFVKRLIKNFDPAEAPTWIGLSDTQKEGGCMWSDGSKITYQAWNIGQPDNARGVEHCVVTNGPTAKKWNDYPCSSKFSFVCKAREKGL